MSEEPTADGAPSPDTAPAGADAPKPRAPRKAPAKPAPKSPAGKSPVAKSPAAKSSKPAAAKSTTDRSTTAKSTTGKSTTGKSTTPRSTTGKPATGESATAKPTAAKSTTAKSPTSKSATAKSTTTKSTTSKPSTSTSSSAKSGAARTTASKPTPRRPTKAAPEPSEAVAEEPTAPEGVSEAVSEAASEESALAETVTEEPTVSDAASDTASDTASTELAPAPESEPEPEPELESDPEPKSDPGPVLELVGLTKRYGDVRAADDITLSLDAGTFTGIVGPNGAGKTTTLSMVTGLLRPTSGTVKVAGVGVWRRPLEAKRLLGVLPDRLHTFDRLTGGQLLYYTGVLHGLDRATARRRTTELAEAFRVEHAMRRLVTDYSSGMLKKIALAAALIHAPRVLILDEPFESVDPVSAMTVAQILRDFVAAGGTVLLSSHSMELVQRICDHVAVIVDGRLIAGGTVDEVRGDQSLQERFIELAGWDAESSADLTWLHRFSD